MDQKPSEIEHFDRVKKVGIFEQCLVDQQNDLYEVRSSLEKQVDVFQNDVNSYTEQLTFEPTKRLEKEIAQMRLHLGTGNLGQSCSQEVSCLQKSICSPSDIRKHYNHQNQKIVKFEPVNQRWLHDTAIETQQTQTETQALSNRIRELEKQLITVPRLSPTKVVQTKASQIVLQQLRDETLDPDKNITEILTTMKSLKRHLESVEQELIHTKIKLAETEIQRDELTMKGRKRYERMRTKMRYYATLVTNLEIQISDMKVQMAKMHSNKKARSS